LLEKIFKIQNKLNELILDKIKGVGFWGALCEKSDSVVNKRFKSIWLLKFNRAQMHESMEFEDSLPWKWWKKGEMNEQNLKVEIVDELHFLVSKCLILGMGAEELFDLYQQKLELNHRRQEEGYLTGEYQKIKNGKEDNEQIR